MYTVSVFSSKGRNLSPFNILGHFNFTTIDKLQALAMLRHENTPESDDDYPYIAGVWMFMARNLYANISIHIM